MSSTCSDGAGTMCKQGDFFLYLELEEGKGVTNAMGLPTQEIERMEGQDPTNPNYIQFQWNSGGLTFGKLANGSLPYLRK